MPFLGTITMEYCDTATEDVSLDQVLEAARKPITGEDWFITLTRANDDFVDATVHEDGRLHLVCDSDNERLVCESADPAVLEGVLRSFYDHDKAWKGLCEWRPPKKKGLLERLFP